uniref:Uncharacterized protein n=1 Tax=Mycena chlorophos TaxID=658473 RepID=A0ABQ0L1U9_MYCCL|nr:predicted protein [Mycena chlorophos]
MCCPRPILPREIGPESSGFSLDARLAKRCSDAATNHFNAPQSTWRPKAVPRPNLLLEVHVLTDSALSESESYSPLRAQGLPGDPRLHAARHQQAINEGADTWQI